MFLHHRVVRPLAVLRLQVATPQVVHKFLAVLLVPSHQVVAHLVMFLPHRVVHHLIVFLPVAVLVKNQVVLVPLRVITHNLLAVLRLVVVIPQAALQALLIVHLVHQVVVLVKLLLLDL